MGSLVALKGGKGSMRRPRPAAGDHVLHGTELPGKCGVFEAGPKKVVGWFPAPTGLLILGGCDPEAGLTFGSLPPCRARNVDDPLSSGVAKLSPARLAR